jgi:hypothetical protein
MAIEIYRKSPAYTYRIGFSGTTLKQAREHLSLVLDEYKKEFRRGMNVRTKCYWKNANSIIVHEVHDCETGDAIEFYILKGD